MTTLDVVLEYDRENRTLHLTAPQKLEIASKTDLESLCRAVTACLADNFDGHKSYMVVDVSAIVIVPALVSAYTNHVAGLTATYLHENGILRYGFAVTRITARASHASAELDAPDFFWSREEAMEFVKALSARRQAESSDVAPEVSSS